MRRGAAEAGRRRRRIRVHVPNGHSVGRSHARSAPTRCRRFHSRSSSLNDHTRIAMTRRIRNRGEEVEQSRCRPAPSRSSGSTQPARHPMSTSSRIRGERSSLSGSCASFHSDSAAQLASLRCLDVAAPRNTRKRSRGIPWRRSTHRARGLRAHPRRGPAAGPRTTCSRALNCRNRTGDTWGTAKSEDRAI